jgi:site-specific DNA-methyltransferase (cytosine-N4-specific)
MRKLLADSEKFYTPKLRPSGHDVARSFDKDNGGAIPPNLLAIPNTESNSRYLRYCKAVGVPAHPARFPAKLPEFFIKFLTKRGDLVLDIFAGSNATGEVAERLGRRWIACDLDRQYVATSIFRFCEDETIARRYFAAISAGEPVNMQGRMAQMMFSADYLSGAPSNTSPVGDG